MSPATSNKRRFRPTGFLAGIRWRLPVIAALVLTLCLTASAKADVVISAYPSLVEIRTAANSKESRDVIVRNEGSEPYQVIATIEPYRDIKDGRSATTWLMVEPKSFELVPGQQRAVKVTLQVPPGQDSGGRYASVAFKTTAQPFDGSGATFSAKLAVPFLITVEGRGPLALKGVVDRLLPVLEADGRLGFRALLLNRGNLHFQARGAVELSREDGTPVGRLALADTTAVLPGSDALIVTQSTLPMVEGASYYAQTVVEYGGGAPATMATAFKATAALDITNVSVREIPEKGPVLQLSLRNRGELGLQPRIRIAMRDGDGRAVGYASPPRPQLVWPGQTVNIETQYPGLLDSGNYSLSARAEFGSASEAERELAFKLGNPAPKPNPDWGVASADATIGIPGVAGWLAATPLLAVLALGAGFAFRPVLASLRRRMLIALKTLRRTEQV